MKVRLFLKEQQEQFQQINMKDLVANGRCLRNIKNSLKYVKMDFSILKTLMEEKRSSLVQ